MDSTRIHDSFVIGAGNSGYRIACDAAGWGYSVIHAEIYDSASGISSTATKLIHRGSRCPGHLPNSAGNPAPTARKWKRYVVKLAWAMTSRDSRLLRVRRGLLGEPSVSPTSINFSPRSARR